MSRFDDHLEILFSCRACPTVAGLPVSGPARGAKVMLIGQAPGPHEEESRRPFAYTAGRRLFGWFDSIGVNEASFRKRVYIAAAIRCFPGRAAAGGDRVPYPDEIERCGAHLDREIRLLRPELVLVTGSLASSIILGTSVLTDLVGKAHRAERAGRAFDVVALPHPSGRSTWLNKEENRRLLDASLQLIRLHPAWKLTVAGERVRPRSSTASSRHRARDG